MLNRFQTNGTKFVTKVIKKLMNFRGHSTFEKAINRVLTSEQKGFNRKRSSDQIINEKIWGFCRKLGG